MNEVNKNANSGKKEFYCKLMDQHIDDECLDGDT